MQIPIISSFKELRPASRKCLLFMAFNVVSWQSIVGPILVLLGREIGMPPSWVGLLLSFMPLSALLVAFTPPLLMRLGPKRMMFAAWTLRNMVACLVFLMPWVIGPESAKAAWYLLIATTLGFSLMRALGVGGWLPWLYEVTPENQRGVYFGAEQATVHLINLLVVLAQGLILHADPTLKRFLIVYGIGVGAGLLSLILMVRIPGGGPMHDKLSLRASFASYRIALRDRHYVRFMATAIGCTSSVIWLSASLVMFMRDALVLPARTIMLVVAGGSFGIMLTVRFWGRFADYSGSGLAMFKALTGHSLAALACLSLAPGSGWTLYVLFPIAFFAHIFLAAYATSTNRAMLNYVRAEGRVGYTSLWTIAMALAMGLTPILAGFVIDRFGLWGFRACFLISGGGGLCGAVLCRYVVRDSEPLTVSMDVLLNPVLPLRTLARIMWITIGMHESNKPGALESDNS